MNFARIPVLLTLAAAALLALTGSASATTVTGSAGETTPKIHLESENGHVKLANPISTIECGSTNVFTIQGHGIGVTATGSLPLLELKWTGCTNSWHVTTIFSGSFELHYVEAGVGTLTWTGMTISATRLGVTCNYKTDGTDIGKLTDSTRVATGTLHVESLIPFDNGSPLCGLGAARWEGSFVSTQKLLIDP
jgi:hypothetical protein